MTSMQKSTHNELVIQFKVSNCYIYMRETLVPVDEKKFTSYKIVISFLILLDKSSTQKKKHKILPLVKKKQLSV